MGARQGLHVVLSAADVAGLEGLLTRRFDAIAGIVAGVDARAAQVSKEEDRAYIMSEIHKLDGGVESVTASVCESLRGWLAAEGAKALARVPAGRRGTSLLLHSMARLLQAQGRLDKAAPLCKETLEAFRATLGDRHPNTLVSIGKMGRLLHEQGEVDSALELLCEAATLWLAAIATAIMAPPTLAPPPPPDRCPYRRPHRRSHTACSLTELTYNSPQFSLI